MKDALRLASKPIKHMNLTPPKPSRTCEALAQLEVHGLHALGEHDLVDSACRWEGEETENDKVRNEETRAADRKTVCHQTCSRAVRPSLVA